MHNFVGTIGPIFGYTLTTISKSDRHNGLVAEKVKLGRIVSLPACNTNNLVYSVVKGSNRYKTEQASG